MVPLWVVGVGSAVFLGMFIREIRLNNKLEQEADILAQYLGYMTLRFDYSPTYEDMIKLVGVDKDKIDKILNEQEEEES